MLTQTAQLIHGGWVGLGQSIGVDQRRNERGSRAVLFPSNANQWQDDPYILLTDIMRTQRKLLGYCQPGRRFYTDFVCLAGSEQAFRH